MHEPSLHALEYGKILERLARHTAFSAGRELALALQPATLLEESRSRLAATTEAVRLLRANSPIGIGGARDVRPLVERAEREGLLDPAQFLDLLSTLQAAGHLQKMLQRLDATFPMLQGLIPGLYPLVPLQQAITRCIGPQGEVLDGASPRLGAIRAEIHGLQSRLNERMQGLIGRYRTHLQEAIITQRQGRYVLAVKAGSKRNVPGLVHDHSASGATLYIEPLELVEVGNELRERELEEQEEVRRILLELSNQVASSAAAIRETVATLAQADLVLARARLSIAMDGVEPALVVRQAGPETDRRDDRLVVFPPTDRGEEPGPWPEAVVLPRGEAPLSMKQARHPLLDPATVVPIDVELGGAFRVLVITGPNTGGKTVALKTVGLLTLMAQAGLHVPTAKGARLPLMRQVFADIGDEQSIEQSLSTFSAHMTRLIQILDRAAGDSLVLLDELGAGTDPVEGAALARALIEALLQRGCLLLVTTHHSELKAYAYATPGVENACVEFDVERLSPTYVLTIGLPGRSNALAIAGRLGLNPEILTRARSWLRAEDVHVESLLEQIQQEHTETRLALEEARESREHAHDLEARLEREIREFERQRHDLLAKTRAEAEKALVDVRERVEALQRELSRASATHEWLTQARHEVAATEALVPEVPPAPPEEKVVLADRAERPGVGDAVWVESLGTVGEVLSPPDAEGQVEVQVGSFKVRRSLGDLRKASRPEELRAAPAVQTPIVTRSAPIELEIRGLRVADVEDVLDRYLNDAYLAGLPFVRIIHGKGTGVLRQVVREILSTHPLVASFAGAPDRDGGEGATMAHLVSR
jgi:DNA mismatch repair protein MutS2